MGNLYELIKKSDANQKYLIATVVEGEHSGEKVFVSLEKIVYETGKSSFLKQHIEIILNQLETGLITVDGNRIFCEILQPDKKLVICGAGHVSIPIIKIGLMADFSVSVIEDRYTFANDALRAGANQVICEPFEQGLKKIEGDKNTYFVIVTRGHRYDQICLEGIIKKENAYIGMIGSKVRVKNVKDQLAQKGVNLEKLEKVHTPIGLKIRAETPVEIAISVMAEIVQEKNQKKQSCGYSKEILETLNAAEKLSEKKVMATIISRKGSAPREVGTKMLIYPDGRTVESLGGGCAEADIKIRALSILNSDKAKSELHRVDMTGWQAEEEGMVCGGIIEVFLESVVP
ncbi:XdhC family protein [Acetobacterium sp.]|uniref:XdhC family protein n=1 Tax=Acetobacterium sp. TaxID=1872094 RepID=UPI00359320DD